MAGEVAHVVYGAQVLAFLKEKVKTPAFWAGTLFPDVRHFGIVSRSHAHPANVSLSTLRGESDFITGMRVHAWLDEVRMKFLHEKNIKEILYWHPFVPHALKLVEDELLYEQFDDWNLIHRVLNKVYDEELEYINSPQSVKTWHGVLQDYFKQAPTNESRLQLSLAIGLSEDIAKELNSVIKILQADDKAENLIKEFTYHLDLLLQ
jgi:hypothetical protein